MRPRAPAWLAFGFLACAPRLEPEREPGPSAAHFTVATFNVYHPASNDPATIEAVASTSADVVLLQEVTASWERALETRYRSEYPHMSFDAAGGASGLGVLSRFPILGRELLAPAMKHPAALVRVETPAGPVQVLNVHLRSLSSPKRGWIGGYLAVPRDHVREIEAFAAACEAGPTLVVGDFNEGPRGAAVAFLERRGFRNALPLYRPGTPTWRGRSLAGQFTLAIDHILFDRHFEPLGSWTVRAGNSDHWPVVARFEFKRALLALAVTPETPRPLPSAAVD